jgi:hypothetical protein
VAPERQLSALTSLCSCDRGTSERVELPICRPFSRNVWATGLGHEPCVRAYLDNKKCLFAGISKDGSDGTRTRDLRRDRPVRRNWLQPATTGNYRLEQVFPRFANRL